MNALIVLIIENIYSSLGAGIDGHSGEVGQVLCTTQDMSYMRYAITLVVLLMVLVSGRLTLLVLVSPDVLLPAKNHPLL